MFSDCIVVNAHRAAAIVPVAEQTVGVTFTDTRVKNLIAVVTVTGRTMGTLAVTAQDAPALAGTYASLGIPAPLAIGGNGVFYMEFVGAMSAYLRFNLAPAAAFDGVVSIALCADGVIVATSG